MFSSQGFDQAKHPVDLHATLVSEAFSLGLFNQNLHALAVFYGAIVPTELKFRGVAVQVLAAACGACSQVRKGVGGSHNRKCVQSVRPPRPI